MENKENKEDVIVMEDTTWKMMIPNLQALLNGVNTDMPTKNQPLFNTQSPKQCET
jgi:hypothetical protein